PQQVVAKPAELDAGLNPGRERGEPLLAPAGLVERVRERVHGPRVPGVPREGRLGGAEGLGAPPPSSRPNAWRPSMNESSAPAASARASWNRSSRNRQTAAPARASASRSSRAAAARKRSSAPASHASSPRTPRS